MLCCVFINLQVFAWVKVMLFSVYHWLVIFTNVIISNGQQIILHLGSAGVLGCSGTGLGDILDRVALVLNDSCTIYHIFATLTPNGKLNGRHYCIIMV